MIIIFDDFFLNINRDYLKKNDEDKKKIQLKRAWQDEDDETNSK